MTPIMWIAAGIVTVVFVVSFGLTLTQGSRERSIERLGRSVGLAVPESLKTQLAARNATRARSASVGVLIGTAVIILAILLGIVPTSPAPESTGDLWMLVGGSIAGLAIGAAVAALRTKPVVPEGERFARSGAVTLEDYLAPVDLVGARVAAVLSVIVSVIAGVLLATGAIVMTPALIVAGLVVALGLAGLVMFEIVGRRILDHALPVGSPAELAWNDALRARSMRDVVTVPLCLGMWGSLAVLLAIAYTEPFTIVASVAAVVVFASLLAAAFVSIASRPQQHFLRRLWPDVAAQRAGVEATV
ncbi:MAG: hypothetical protein ACOH19_01655 [Rhodoglobus sp.]